MASRLAELLEDPQAAFEAAAARTQQGVRPEGGRRAGMLTAAIEGALPNAAQGFVDTMEGAKREALSAALGGDYNAKPVMELAASTLMPGRPPGALGAGPSGIKSALPMDEASRMARAQAQGYTIDAYKGSYPYDWRTVPERDWKGNIIKGTENRVPQELTEFDARRAFPDSNAAGFFSNDPAVASRFATAMGQGAVYPVKLKFSNPKVIDAEGAFAADFQFGPGAGRLKLPKDSPHDGVILKNTKDEGDVYIPKDSSQIRSKFAAFDPANAGSGGLLGSLAITAALENDNQ